MNRLTSEDEKRVKDTLHAFKHWSQGYGNNEHYVDTHGPDMELLLSEIDALREEIKLLHLSKEIMERPELYRQACLQAQQERLFGTHITCDKCKGVIEYGNLHRCIPIFDDDEKVVGYVNGDKKPGEWI